MSEEDVEAFPEMAEVTTSEIRTGFDKEIKLGSELKGWQAFPESARELVVVSQKHSLIILADKTRLYFVNEQVLFKGTVAISLLTFRG
jgi:hypothetical protein